MRNSREAAERKAAAAEAAWAAAQQVALRQLEAADHHRQVAVGNLRYTLSRCGLHCLAVMMACYTGLFPCCCRVM